MIFLAFDFTQFTGRLHPLIVHLPIGMIVLAALLYWMSGTERWNQVKNALSSIFLLSAITSTMSVVAGLMLATGDAYSPSSIFWHKWLGIVTAIVSWTSWYFYRSETTQNRGFKISFWIMLITLVLAGHKGGQITHGKNYLVKYAPGFIAKIFGASVVDVDNYLIPDAEMDSTEAYYHIIRPMLEAKCTQCHNERKSNGKLMLTSFADITNGGSSGDILKAGNPFESELFSRTTLPQTSSKFMPPEGTPLTYKEQEVLSWWIMSGHQEKIKLRSMDIPKDILGHLEELYGYSHKPKSFVEKNQIAEADSAAMAAAIEAGFKVQPIAASTNFLDAFVHPDFKEVTPEMLSYLDPIKDNISWLSLPDKNITNEMVKVIGSFSNLSKLKIQNNPISDVGVSHLQELANLEVLNLYNTQVTDESVEFLSALKTLKNLFLWQTNVTPDGIEMLRNALPNTEVIAGLDLATNEKD